MGKLPLAFTPLIPSSKNPRIAAFLAVLWSLQGKSFVSDTLKKWREAQHPSKEDEALAQEISNGTMKRQITLDHYLHQLNPPRRLKLKEKVLIRTALYQYMMMDRIPLYAIVHETVEIAKAFCHSTFISLLNALLRKCEHQVFDLPENHSIESLSIRYSLPSSYIRELRKSYNEQEVLHICECSNTSPIPMVRARSSVQEKPVKWVINEPLHVFITDSISSYLNSEKFYIQNVTPAYLMGWACHGTFNPATILDLCASPGGKTLAAHDLFPQATLFANDVTREKLLTLEENFEKYHLGVHLTMGKGEDYPTDKKFDLVIVDAPCSNSGVYHKRAEARWRFSEENLRELNKMQLSLLKKASELVTDQGEIWYLTCSIIPAENELLIESARSTCGLTKIDQKTILPNREGWDGGFCARLK
ncbi:MAG: 16S rRNA (cytosine(967)-C(5))-methyltransferase RsmB [Chlamydiales bacterium]